MATKLEIFGVASLGDFIDELEDARDSYQDEEEAAFSACSILTFQCAPGRPEASFHHQDIKQEQRFCTPRGRRIRHY